MDERDWGVGADDAPKPGFLDGLKALVVGRSHVTCVVVSSILEKAGLKATSVLPEQAEALLGDGFLPGMIVLDGGTDNAECDALAHRIATLRRSSGGHIPPVVLLSNRNLPLPLAPSSAWPAGVIDAVVTKPITPERLQVVVRRLLSAGGKASATGLPE